MSTYLVKFKPAEPYFFGNEKVLSFPGSKQKNSSYFVKGEYMPSQTTLLGALRYILLPHKDFPDDSIKQNENAAAVGAQSFRIDSAEKLSFGKIKKISPVFLVEGENVIIPAPLDHNKASESDTYCPFKNYCDVDTINGKKICAIDYDVKEGLTGDFLSVNDRKIIEKSQIFKSSVRVGINRDKGNDGFFKKEYKILNDKYSFAVYAEIESLNTDSEIVCLGQGRTAFSVTFTEKVNTLETQIKALLQDTHKNIWENKELVYCLGDAFVNSNPSSDALFSAFSTKDYRSLVTEGNNSYKKGDTLYRLIKAGSVFIVNDANQWMDKFVKPNAHQIGYNYFINTEE